MVETSLLREAFKGYVAREIKEGEEAEEVLYGKTRDPVQKELYERLSPLMVNEYVKLFKGDITEEEFKNKKLEKLEKEMNFLIKREVVDYEVAEDVSYFMNAYIKNLISKIEAINLESFQDTKKIVEKAI